jgi:hypothetical protein
MYCMVAESGVGAKPQPMVSTRGPDLFEAMEDSQRRVMLKGSQAKAIFMQGIC